METKIEEPIKPKGTIVSIDTGAKFGIKKMMKDAQLKFTSMGVDCHKCGNLARKIPLIKIAREIRDYLTINHAFHCFAYCCEYCEITDIEILTYF
jgi:hypothetical protein